ncbi:MAG: FHA domain-containing protein, partial [Oscillospiraceae bacterium]|jgi:hypothetical protein|nr:FHA domain-containing protein [Oscillospiraceae bacterium]
VFGTRYDQNENNDYVAALISYLNGADAFSLSDFAVLLRQLSGEAPAAPTASAAAPGSTPGMPGIQARAAAPVPAPPANSVNPISPPRAEPKPAAASIPSAPPAISAPPAMSSPPPAAPDTAAPPPRPPIKLPPPTATPVAAPPAKKITLLDLLMHYSKENKAAYDAQRAAAKAGNDTRAAAAAANDTRAPKASEPRPSGGFAVPGERPVMPRESASPTPSAAPTPVQAYQTAPPVNAPPRRAGNFGETVMLGGDDAIPVTSSLGDGAEARSAYLVRSANNERIALTKPVFRIGKERDFADYFIGDNTAVSRSHAEIISRGGEYFVSDMNSTNHTYLDGEMLQGGMETPLRHGAKITLANEEFEFRLR